MPPFTNTHWSFNELWVNIDGAMKSKGIFCRGSLCQICHKIGSFIDHIFIFWTNILLLFIHHQSRRDQPPNRAFPVLRFTNFDCTLIRANYTISSPPSVVVYFYFATQYCIGVLCKDHFPSCPFVVKVINSQDNFTVPVWFQVQFVSLLWPWFTLKTIPLIREASLKWTTTTKHENATPDCNYCNIAMHLDFFVPNPATQKCKAAW